jgi:hypothetical protein
MKESLINNYFLKNSSIKIKNYPVIFLNLFQDTWQKNLKEVN